MKLDIQTRKSGEVAIVDVRGRVTIGPTNDLLGQRLRELVDTGTKLILLNLAETLQVDSSAISTIVRTFVSLNRMGGDFKLLSPQGRVREVLQVTHLLGTIPSFDEEAKALSSFR